MGLIPVVHNANNKFAVATVHYSVDPEKNTPVWLEEAKRGMTERGWNREYEIDYSIFAGKPFFPEFQQYNIAKREFVVPERATIYRGWDYGFHRPACLITYLNDFDQWCWIRGILGEDEGIRTFGKRVREYCLGHYPGAMFIDAGDPAGNQISDKGDKTSAQILEAMGIHVRSRRQPRKQGAEIIRQKLQMRADGKVGLLVNPGEQLTIDGFKGGIHYPMPKEGSPEKEYYEKDGIYEHIFDAARYLAVEMFDVTGEQQRANEITRLDPNQERYRMGRVVDPNENNLYDNINDPFSGEYF